MKIVSWNCRGLGSNKKLDSMKDLISTTSLNILMIQETKMEEACFLQLAPFFWKFFEGLAVSARGASGGIGSLWRKDGFNLIHSVSNTHWILSILLHKDSSIQLSLFNIYVPILYMEKKSWWKSIQDCLSSQNINNIILVGDLNITLRFKDKKGVQFLEIHFAKRWRIS